MGSANLRRSYSTAVGRFVTCPLNRLKLIARHISATPPRSMTKTFKVAKVSELKDGQMKEVEIPGTDGKVLLSKVKGQFYATGARCTRTFSVPSNRGRLIGVDYGAPLKNGVLTESGRLVCPWHGIFASEFATADGGRRLFQSSDW